MGHDIDKIAAFIRRHHVMTIATVGATYDVEAAAAVGTGAAVGAATSPSSYVQPWVAHAFYAWMADEKCFVFMNNPATRHGAEMVANSRVAAAIVLETRVVGRLQGVQIEGVVRMAGGDELVAARNAYLKRFPYAVAMEQPLWILAPSHIKFTDNTLGFGKKLIWNLGPQPVIARSETTKQSMP
jgi:uncharacterized protein YhbP (UPF0306 family)